MSHSKSRLITREQLEVLPRPEWTSTHCPTPFAELAKLARETVSAVIPGLELVKEQYALAKKDQRFFATLTYKADNPESGIALGLRGSYDKSLQAAVAAGAQVFVCDNLCFSGSAFRVQRKNTKYSYRDLQHLLVQQASGLEQAYHAQTKQHASWKHTGCGLEKGYAFLGMMRGRGLLSSRQYEVALGDWTTPRHEEFSDRTAWALYNCVTEGLKVGSPDRYLVTHTKAHDGFAGMVTA
jgi:hypothetical protein